MTNTSENYLKIKSKAKYFIFLCLYFFLYPICKALYGRKKYWIVCERGNDAQDNGFIFYKYLCDNHPELKVYYLIKKTSPDYTKVSKIGKTVHFGSAKHFFMVIGCPVKISSNLFGYAPWVQLNQFYRRKKTSDYHIFLQHGITKNLHEGFYYENCKSLKLFICGAKPEYDYIFNAFHYLNEVPQYTGFARYDYLSHFASKKQILVMPTWRANLVNLSDDDFKKTDFYMYWNRLLSDNTLINLCKENHLIVKFYLHYSFQRFSHLFSSTDVIRVIGYGEETVQNLLKESKILITDFSSVYFDFAYMEKPLIYYQFDEATFNDCHYKKGYFDYRKDGFGDVCLTSCEVIDAFRQILSSNFIIKKVYHDRIEKSFIYRDNNNCKRIYEAILRVLKK